ncbi:MAG: type II toxin-antitoxin system RelE/ParE family toxin [Bacteroidetes bacterium]|nr:type II toxin-antitoxin system RelE/ParE family toxin [Bacteroidota bacterium]
MKLKLSKKALADIEGIWLFTVENWSVEQADRYYNLIFDEIEFLTKNPLSGKDYASVRKNYRCSRVQSHLIFYRIATNKETVEIIRVLHQRMDIETILHE